MLHPNFLQQKLAREEPVIGTWSIFPSPLCIEAIALAELDFIILDREHGPSSFETIASSILACEKWGVSPLVRVSDLSRAEVQRALDTGAHALHVPNIETLSQLDQLIDWAKYPPLGTRGLSPYTRAAHYNSLEAKRQVLEANDRTLLAVHLEGKEAFERLDLFLERESIDIFFIGLYDLSKSLGKPGLTDDPEVLHYLRKSAAQIRAAGKTAGTIASHPQQIEQYLSYGINYITYSADCHVVQQAYRSVVSTFQKTKTETKHEQLGIGNQR